MRISVIGTGHLGATHAACLAHMGHEVVDEFRKMQLDDLAEVTQSKCIIDARNCLDPRAWRDAGWTYRGFGRL